MTGRYDVPAGAMRRAAEDALAAEVGTGDGPLSVTAVATGVLGLVSGSPRAAADRLGARAGGRRRPSRTRPPRHAEAAEAAEAGTDPEEPKELYVDIAARPGLAWKTALASGVSAALLGLVFGWNLSLLVVLPLVPVERRPVRDRLADQDAADEADRAGVRRDPGGDPGVACGSRMAHRHLARPGARLRSAWLD